MGEAPFESGSGQQEPTAEGGSTGISNPDVESLYAVPRGLFFYSYRRDGAGGRDGYLSVIGIRP